MVKTSVMDEISDNGLELNKLRNLSIPQEIEIKVLAHYSLHQISGLNLFLSSGNTNCALYLGDKEYSREATNVCY